MKPIIKFAVILGAFFTLTLLVFKVFDLLTVEDIKAWLTQLQHAPHWVIGLFIISLLIVDLFIAVPTLSLTILSGFFVGVELGVLYSSVGMAGAGTLGYGLSRYKGESFLKKLCKNDEELSDMKSLFSAHGPMALSLCRAAPMLPEISSCLAGVTKMPFRKYILFYLLGTIPYAIIAAYAGSISSIDNPSPAFYTFIGMFVVLTLAWGIFFLYKRSKKTKTMPDNSN